MKMTNILTEQIFLHILKYPTIMSYLEECKIL